MATLNLGPRPEEQLTALQTEAAALRAEMEDLNAAGEAFRQTLTKLAATETKLKQLRTQTAKLRQTTAEGLQQTDNLQQTALEQERERHEARRQLQTETTEHELAQLQQRTAAKLESLAEIKDAEERQLQTERQLAEARTALSRTVTDAFREMNSGFLQGNKQFAAAQRTLFLFSKAVAARDVIINLQKELATINATYAAAPPVAAALTAKAVAQGAIRLATIGAQAVPKLARGGRLQGASHAEGGIQLIDSRTGRVTAEAEGGELILTRGVSDNPVLLRLASQINELAGGVQLSPARYRPTPKMAQGGQVPAATGDAGFTNRLERLLEQVANRPAVVSVEEINRAQQRVHVLEDGGAL